MKLQLLLLVAVVVTSPPGGAAADEACVDTCRYGAETAGASCQLWNAESASWMSELSDGPGRMHNRARRHIAWLRERMLPAGGVMSAQFTTPALDTVAGYGGRRDSAIWTGAYLAAEALRKQVTGASDADSQIAETVRVLHRWWNISGDPGYLARFAAPADNSPQILALLPADDPEVVSNVPFEGGRWHWRGQTSRDQYQGVILGYSIAYEATDDPDLREMIREDIVEFAEQLMRRERRTVDVVIDGVGSFRTRLTLQHVVYTDDESPDGTPLLMVETFPFDVKGLGMLVFWPNPTEFVRTIPGLGWLPDVLLPTQAIQLAAIFRVALQVSAGVPGYEARHQALQQHYDKHFDEWLAIAADWENTKNCGDAYFGINIAFMPLYSWIRLETDPARRASLQRDVLRDALWASVEDHKNPFFAFIHASQAAPDASLAGIADAHAAQLDRFPSAPGLALPVDLRSKYPEDPHCPGLSAVAVNVDERVPATFVWERQPWKLFDPGFPNLVYPGVDYVLTYWLGRYSGFIADDTPGSCLRWRRRVTLDNALPSRGGWRVILSR